MAKVNAKYKVNHGSAGKFPIEMDIDVMAKTEGKILLENLSIFFNKWYNHKELSAKLLAMSKV
jgi:hypothetical protein